MAYDIRCYGLAKSFLPSGASENLRQDLAQHIQNSIEEFITNSIITIAHQIAATKTKINPSE